MGISERIIQLLRHKNDIVMAEIGVARAESAVKWLKSDKIAHYYGIDPWLSYEESPEAEFELGYIDRKMALIPTQNEWDSVHQEAIKNLSSYQDKVTLIRDFSHKALPTLPNDLDLISIDGNHQYEYVIKDLQLSYAQLKEGGILVIDDYHFSGGDVLDGKYGGLEACEVKRAVKDFCLEKELQYFVVDGNAIIHKTTDSFKQYKSLHKGERVFLIGNGPSLADTDLDLIANEKSIAMNRVSLLYKETSWRPTYYLFASDNINHPIWGDDWQESVNLAVSQKETKSFIWSEFADRVNDHPNIHYFDHVTEPEIAEEGSFSLNVSQFISKTGTTMNMALQLALYMGFSEIILLGCDMNWRSSKSESVDPNHFHPDYQANIPDGFTEQQRMRKTHETAHQKILKQGSRVYNASIKTVLDVYPLVEYEDIVKNPNSFKDKKIDIDPHQLYKLPNSTERTFVYGAGYAGQKALSFIEAQVLGFIDDNEEIHSQMLANHKISSCEEALQADYDIILIANYHHSDAIENKLINNYKVDISKIRHIPRKLIEKA